MTKQKQESAKNLKSKRREMRNDEPHNEERKKNRCRLRIKRERGLKGRRGSESQHIDRSDLSAARQPGRRLSLCCHSLACRHLTPSAATGVVASDWGPCVSLYALGSCVCGKRACPVAPFYAVFSHGACVCQLPWPCVFQGLRCGVSSPPWN